MPVAVTRVERVVGRPAKDWLAPDIAKIIAMMKSVADGMASVDEAFPPMEEAKPAPEAAGQAPVPAAAPEGGEQGVQSATVTDEVAARSHAAHDPAVTAAHARGQEEKAAGASRKAVPGEYRDAASTALAAAWLKGWDGTPL